MFDRENLNFVGPAGVIAAIACAEFAGYGLATRPASVFLWYLNLEVFRCFQYGSAGFGELIPLAPLHVTALVALALIGLVSTSLICAVRLPLAIACDFSFVYSLTLWCGSYLANAGRVATFDLSALFAPSSLLPIGLVLVTSISSAISHRRYWREIAPQNGSTRAAAATSI
jgi:hypothetical protein